MTDLIKILIESLLEFKETFLVMNRFKRFKKDDDLALNDRRNLN